MSKINLDDLIKVREDVLDENTSNHTLEINEDHTLTVDIHEILTEWAARCDTGCPVYGNLADMVHLQHILDEYNIALPFDRIAEAKGDSKTASTPTQLYGWPTLDSFMSRCPQTVRNYIAKEILDIVNNDDTTKKTLDDLYGTRTVEALSNFKFDTGTIKKMRNIKPLGMGPGEVLIAWLVPNAKISGQGESYDIAVGELHYEVKDMAKPTGKADSTEAFRGAKALQMSRYDNISVPIKTFFKNVIDPYVTDQSFKPKLKAFLDEFSDANTTKKLLDCIDRLKNKSVSTGRDNTRTNFSRSINEFSGDMFNLTYTTFLDLNTLTPTIKTLLGYLNATDAKITVFNGNTKQATYYIDEKDADTIEDASETPSKNPVKVTVKGTPHDKEDIRDWFTELYTNVFIQSPDELINRLVAARDEFMSGKDGLIILVSSGFKFLKDLSNFYVQRITGNGLKVNFNSNAPDNEFVKAQIAHSSNT